MITVKKAIYTFALALLALCLMPAARANQVNGLNISSVGIDAAMLGSFIGQTNSVGPNRLGEFTLPGAVAGDSVFQGSGRVDVNDPVLIQGTRNISAVPERSTWSMLLLGSGLLVAMMRFRKRAHR